MLEKLSRSSRALACCNISARRESTMSLTVDSLNPEVRSLRAGLRSAPDCYPDHSGNTSTTVHFLRPTMCPDRWTSVESSQALSCHESQRLTLPFCGVVSPDSRHPVSGASLVNLRRRRGGRRGNVVVDLPGHVTPGIDALLDCVGNVDNLVTFIFQPGVNGALYHYTHRHQ